MHYAQLLAIIDKSGLSPEKAARELGLSGMSLRRWRRKPSGAELPEMYRRACEPMLRRLIAAGSLSPDDPNVAAALVPPEDPFLKTLRDSGITHEALKSPRKSPGAIVSGLAHIGSDQNRQLQVGKSLPMMDKFRGMSAKWKAHIDDLWLALRSDKLNALDKLVAFGALFYLITPFDLIPDTIPGFGLMDDFIVLGIAALYYRKRFPLIFRAGAGDKKTRKRG